MDKSTPNFICLNPSSRQLEIVSNIYSPRGSKISTVDLDDLRQQVLDNTRSICMSEKVFQGNTNVSLDVYFPEDVNLGLPFDLSEVIASAMTTAAQKFNPGQKGKDVLHGNIETE